MSKSLLEDDSLIRFSETSKPSVNNEITEIYRRQVKTVYGVCFTYMKNAADTEDAVSDTFVKMIKASPLFESQEHEKAWLVRTASNVCKDYLKHWWQKRRNIEDYSNSLNAEDGLEIDETMEIILSLPERYKAVIYLYYYEGYNSVEISGILKKPQSTIRNHLHEARQVLREKLGGDFE